MAGVTDAPFRGVCSRFGAGLYVSEMITARALVERNARTLVDAALRRLGGHPVGAALRHRPAHARRGRAVPRRRDRRRPRRHELRLPGPQGHPQGRRLGAPRAPARCCATSSAPRSPRPDPIPVTIKFRMGVDDDDPHLPRHRPHRRGGGRGRHRAARPHRRAALQRLGPLGRHRRAEGPRHHDPGARQRRHLGGPRRAGDDRPRPAATAWWSAAAASGGRGCSATWSTPSPAARCSRRRASAGSPR